MKIAVFGDSFGDERNIFVKENWSWANCIRQQGYDITNFCKCASSLSYSYIQFEKHQSEYDKIIFLVTGPERLYLPHLPEKFQFITNGLVRYYKKYAQSSAEKEIVEALEGYYKIISTPQQELLQERLILNSAKVARPDTLFIPCFRLETFSTVDFVIDDLSRFDYEYFNISQTGDTFINDKRFCHMNRNNNKLFAAKIIEWMNTGNFLIRPEEFQKPESENFNDLFEIESI